MEENLLSVLEAAKKLQVNRSRIYVWIKQGRLPVVSVTIRRGKEGTQTREVWRIPDSKCLIPKSKKHGPKPPDIPRLITPYTGNPRPKKKKPPKRKQPVELK